MSNPAPTLDDLRQQLADARHSFELAQFIDHFPDYKRERDHWAARIRTLLGEINKMEEGGEH